jgi:pimeloyl-ACP methyl ester carboxylesterase
VTRVPPHHNEGVTIPPETRYARNGAIHLAYQVLGSGPPNLLVVGPGLNGHVDYAWMEPSLARFMRRLASFSRLIVYDNRGAGLSDPVPGGAAPGMDEQVDDIRAILDETGCQRAVLAGNGPGCAPALVFAATHPGRVESLILLNGYARLRAGAGYPQGLDQVHIDQIADAILGTWGTGADLDLFAPAVAADDNFRRWYAQIQRLSASPATAAAMIRLWYEFDVRAVLPTISVPTLVIAAAGNATIPAHHSRYVAEHIAGAQYIEFPDADLLYFAGHADQVLDAIEEFVTGARPLPSPDRFLGTVLFVDVAGSTRLAAEIGDGRFRDLVFLDLPRRAAKILLSQPRGNDGIIRHKMSQEQLAHQVGSTRQSVNAALRGFERRGWIDMHDRAVIVAQPVELSRFAGTEVSTS